MTIPTIDGIQGFATSGTEVASFSTHVFTKIRRDGMRKSMQSILGILTGTAIAATPNALYQLVLAVAGISPVVYQLHR